MTVGEPSEQVETEQTEEISEMASASESSKSSLPENEPFETLISDVSESLRSQLRY